MQGLEKQDYRDPIDITWLSETIVKKMAADELSAADKLKIATHFILSSPSGQLKDVVSGMFSLWHGFLLLFTSFLSADVKIVVNDNRVLSPNVIADLEQKYNQDNMQIAATAAGNVITRALKFFTEVFWGGQFVSAFDLRSWKSSSRILFRSQI